MWLLQVFSAGESTHASGAITFAVHISSHVSKGLKTELGTAHPTYTPKLACSSWFGMLSSNLHSISAPMADSSHW